LSHTSPRCPTDDHPKAPFSTPDPPAGIEVRTIVVDSDRAPDVTWAFETYAQGEHSISELRDLLEERGFKSRTTRKITGKPINSSQLHRLLTNPYYIGQVRFNDVLYPGRHDPLVDEATWQRVQDILAIRRIAGDRSWKHSHYLKDTGLLRCGRCDGRIGYGSSNGRGGTYDYFFCLGRHTGRTSCDLPYLAVTEVEDAIIRHWTRVRFTGGQIETFSRGARDQLHRSAESGSRLLTDQRRRLAQLERQQQKLLDAYMADALPIDLLKKRQSQVATEIGDAKRLMADVQGGSDQIHARLDQVIDLLTHAERLYGECGPEGRAILNTAVFAGFRLDMAAEGPTNGQAAVEPELSPIVSTIVANHASADGHERTPGDFNFTGGSNLTQLAVAEGFEPSVDLRRQTLSRRSP
jgi:site-specific DNA recombinase